MKQIIELYKYLGNGEDEILIDNRDGRYDDFINNKELMSILGDRRQGVGTTAILVIQSQHTLAYELLYFDAYGVKQGVCGTGSCISVAHACTYFLSKQDGEEIEFMLDDGIHTGSFDSKTNTGSITMRDLKVVTEGENDYFANSGTPQYIRFVDDSSTMNVIDEGAKLSVEKKYLCSKSPIIVSFVEERKDGLYPRCYDPGQGDESWACGTASVAMTMCHATKHGVQDGDSGSTYIRWRQGTIVVSYTYKSGMFTNIKLSSSLKRIFKVLYEP